MALSRRLISKSLQQPIFVAKRYEWSDTFAIPNKDKKGMTILGTETPSNAPHPNEPKINGMFDRLGTLWVPPESELKKWRYVPADYKEHPERDLKNFPHVQIQQFPAKTRLAVFPDSWFKFFYNKTGETGGYLFFGGLGTYLFSKEVLIWDIQMIATYNYSLIFMIIYYFGGKAINEVRNEYVNNFEGVWQWEAWQRQQHQQVIDEAKKAIESAKQVHALLYDAKRENVALQQEAVYRERVQQIYEDVKKRVEFLAEYEGTKRRFEQQYMIDWIMKQVRASITPQMEAATLKQCIADLKTLAQKK